jgi:hypothetical protein
MLPTNHDIPINNMSDDDMTLMQNLLILDIEGLESALCDLRQLAGRFLTSHAMREHDL